MMMSAVLAVALGVAPVDDNGKPQIVSVNESELAHAVGRYSQSVDSRGRTHLTGLDRRTGSPFDVAIDGNGDVEAEVGAWIVTFNVKDAS